MLQLTFTALVTNQCGNFLPKKLIIISKYRARTKEVKSPFSVTISIALKSQNFFPTIYRSHSHLGPQIEQKSRMVYESIIAQLSFEMWEESLHIYYHNIYQNFKILKKYFSDQNLTLSLTLKILHLALSESHLHNAMQIIFPKG